MAYMYAIARRVAGRIRTSSSVPWTCCEAAVGPYPSCPDLAGHAAGAAQSMFAVHQRGAAPAVPDQRRRADRRPLSNPAVPGVAGAAPGRAGSGWIGEVMEVDRQARRAAIFAGLHRSGAPLLLANAWDVASAVTIAGAGAKAIATTSAGVAWSLGVPDAADLGADRAAAVIERITAAVEVPVSADIEAGYGPAPDAVAATMTAVIQAAYAVAARATRELLTDGTYDSTADGIPYDKTNDALASRPATQEAR